MDISDSVGGGRMTGQTRPMSGKQRVRIALDHREADRVPVWELGFHNAVASQVMGRDILLPVGGGGTLREVLLANSVDRSTRQQIITRIVDDTLATFGSLGYDMVRVRPTDFLTPVFFGSGNWSPNAILDARVETLSDNVWRVSGPEGFWSIHKYSEISCSLADADDSIKQGGLAELRRYVEFLERQPIDLSLPPLEDALDGIRQTVTHPLATDIFILGWGDVCYPGSTAHVTVFLEAMILEPELVERYMEVTTKGILALMRAQAALGVDGFTGGNDWAFKTGPMFSVRHLRRFIAPYLKQVVDEAHCLGRPYIKHADGNMRSHIPVLVDEVGIDGLHSIEPDANMDIFDLKRRYAGRLTLLGNLDCDLLVRGTADEIDATVHRLMCEVAPGGGYVFSTANTVLMDVPMCNLEAMLMAARRYGSYPISC